MIFIFIRNLLNMHDNIICNQCFSKRKIMIKINFGFCIIMRKTYVIHLLNPIRYQILLKLALYFSVRNNTKHLVSLKSLINPLTLSNIIRIGFAPINVLYETRLIKIFLYYFLSNKILSKSRISTLIISLKE